MRKSTMSHHLIISIVTICLVGHTPVSTVAKETSLADDGKEIVNPISNRNKRDLDFNMDDSSMQKRPRQFVGKRGEQLDIIELDKDFIQPNYHNIQDYSPNDLEAPVFGSFIYDENDYQDAIERFNDASHLKNIIEEQDTLQAEDMQQRVADFIAKHGDESSESDTIAELDKRPRQFVGKREDDDEDFDLEKRPRQFVGKRPRQFVGKRPRQFVGKRPRQFVGKRPRQFVGKRPRQFVGKRPRQFVGKRPRQFVGKRPRQFVGKRPRQFVGKRPRQFVGKREFFQPDILEGSEVNKRPRQFVGKRADIGNIGLLKRPRQFVGKRDEFDGMFQQQKRPRQFVGKRDEFDGMFQQQKRPRQFVGKRNIPVYLEFAKRPRQFVGKRESDLLFSKRPRQFVGKRNFEEVTTFSKRPRQFVGKRSDDVDLGLSKRPRQFVGKRSAKDQEFFLQSSLPLDEETFTSSMK